jgi:hypothetical protein
VIQAFFGLEASLGRLSIPKYPFIKLEVDMEFKRQQMGVMSLILFAVTVLVAVVIFSSLDTSTANLASTTVATRAIGNTSVNVYSAMQLISVGPIIFGAVIILGIVGMLYLRR